MMAHPQLYSTKSTEQPWEKTRHELSQSSRRGRMGAALERARRKQESARPDRGWWDAVKRWVRR